MSDLDEAFVKGVAEALVRQSWRELKDWAVGASRWVKRGYRRVARQEFASPAHLLEAATSRQVEDGDLVTVICKPSAFGPILRHVFIPPLIGMRTNLRLGPTIVGENPIFGLISQATSHLTPVGLYPPLGPNVIQGCIYPHVTPVYGLTGLMPVITPTIHNMQAIFASRHQMYFGKACRISGFLRSIDSSDFERIGFKTEDYEVIRQAGRIWYVDASTDEAESVLIDDPVPDEMWGGLYASGHLEVSGSNIPYAVIIDAVKDAFAANGYHADVMRSQGRIDNWSIFARGLRCAIHSKSPYYAIHMDAELAKGFGEARAKFDMICTQTLSGIKNNCAAAGGELKNPFDLDYTYTDSTKNFNVLHSLGADAIADPLAIVIRDWHRRRNSE